MTKKVTVVPIQNEDEFLWTVFEHATDMVVAAFFFEEDAKAYAKLIERGGAFAGYTPAFILVGVNLKLDDKFKVKLI